MYYFCCGLTDVPAPNQSIEQQLAASIKRAFYRVRQCLVEKVNVTVKVNGKKVKDHTKQVVRRGKN